MTRSSNSRVNGVTSMATDSSRSPGKPRHEAVDYERTDSAYLEKRQLKKGAAGWVLLAGLGVAYVISGDYAGWNYGLAQGGWGGLLVATVLMATMYACMVFGLAEMATAMPVAGAGYGFARRALGPLGGFATGTAILIEYAIAPAAIACFIGGYVEALGLFGLTSGWPIYLACFAIFVGIHLWGVGEALKVMFVITAIAVVALIAFVVGMLPKVDARQAARHRADRRRRGEHVPALRRRRGARGAGLRDLVLPRRRGRAAGRRGGARPHPGHAAGDHRRDGGAAGLRRPDPRHRARRGRRVGAPGLGQPAAAGRAHGVRRRQLAGPVRQLRRPRRASSPASSRSSTPTRGCCSRSPAPGTSPVRSR